MRLWERVAWRPSTPACCDAGLLEDVHGVTQSQAVNCACPCLVARESVRAGGAVNRNKVRSALLALGYDPGTGEFEFFLEWGLVESDGSKKGWSNLHGRGA
jgi:hypothetical protein